MKKKLLSFKLYLKFLLFFIFVLLLFVSFINYNVNPGNIYKTSLKNERNKSLPDKFAKELTESKNGIIFNNDVWNIRDLKKSLAKEKMNVDCAIIGSSRVMQISSFRPIKSVPHICPTLINLGVSGTSLEDYLITSEYLLQNIEKPKTILIGIDPWIFIMNREKRWRRHKFEFYLMKNRLESKVDSNENYKEKSMISNTALLLNLFNQEYFKRSIQLFFSKKNEEIVNANKFNYKEGLKDSVLLPDGSLINSNKFLKKDFSKKTNSIVNYDIKGISKLDFNSGKWYQEDAINLFNKLIIYLKKDFEVIFVFAPYHPAVWEVKDQPLVKALLHLEKKIKNMAKYSNIRTIGSYNPNIFKCKKSEFLDFDHPKDECLVKAFK